jgi:S-formylglutathione hydrolase FrmB
MKKNLKNAVVLPANYTSGKSLRVLYLLHGFSDSFNAWLTKPLPDKQLVSKMADKYNLIIVCPDGGFGSWYLDSPEAKDFQFETFIINELIPEVDKKYKTISSREGRLISGLSMGGHGALYLAGRNSDKFIAAGSIAGALDLAAIARDRQGDIQNWFVKLLGNPSQQAERYNAHSVMHMTDKLKASGLKLIIDCGTSDFLYETNKAFHQKMLQEGVPHEYTERPGEHNWLYFANSLEYHLVFFQKVLAQLSQ